VKHAFLDHHSGLDSPIHRLDARTKIIVFFAFILITVSASPSSFRFFGVMAMALIGLALVSKLPLLHLIKKVLVILPFLFLVTVSIPFMKNDGVGGGYNLGPGSISVSRSGLWILWNVMIKSSLGVFSIILLYSTTPFPRLIKGMERLYAPRVFTVLISFMYRYSFILVDEIQRMKRAKDSRSFGGKWIQQTTAIGNMIGTLFLRSFARGERVYMAMLSRGYNGSMPGISLERIGGREILFLSLLPFLVFVRIFLG
jgi:cobalt/nickel transport system permease protein